ncbi:bleomycin resistance protein [Arthrobacter sp. NEB 688]|uniref:bleomycin resistance protein n=1 Tax=Arthrobacter sp. NEB 688 TaxID=904039 RepID=UPI0015674C47|nr:bleomycin resistance protein [Arthrobacter sp. NEB 688]QKE85200.1 bleomycin resistance protein [Arthrobacter sp. NEB 688]
MSEQEQEQGTTTSRVEVPAAPEVAFAVFTDELDLWWVRGPINHVDGGRLRTMRCEPGTGGRLLEVYDEAGEDVLELARITAWDPGRRLAFDSSLDDVSTEVVFEATGTGTLVSVTATLRPGGRDAGGTAWVRTVPKWFGPWVERRGSTAHAVRDIARFGLTVRYARPAAAARWLADVLGLGTPDPLPQEPDPLPHTAYGHPWLELRSAGTSIVVEPLPDGATLDPAADQPWIYVDDVVVEQARVAARGGDAVGPVVSPWGLPFFEVVDPEGRSWRVVQARPTM